MIKQRISILFNEFSAQSILSRRLYANLRSVNTINSSLLSKRSLKITTTNHFYPTSLQNDKPQESSIQHRTSSDPHPHPLGPKDENPYVTGLTREKSHTKGHTVNKADKAFSSDHMQRDLFKGVIGKVKDAFSQFVSPGAPDVQAESAAQGLRAHHKDVKTSSNLQEKAKETADNVKESVGTLQEKAKESYETAKEKIKETLGMNQEKTNEVKETAKKTLDSAKEDSQKTLKSTKDMLQNATKGSQEKGQETI